MADGTVPELTTAQAERLAAEGRKSEGSTEALEGGSWEKAQERIDSDADGAIVEVKDYMNIAANAEDPTLTEEVRKRAEAVEAEIRAAADAAKAEIERTAKGEMAPAASPEAAIAELKKTNVTAATGETASLQSEAEPEETPPVTQRSPVEAPSSPERTDIPAHELVSRLDGIVNEYKGAANQPSKLLQKKLLKLMQDADPEKYPNDVRVPELRSMIARLKLAFDGSTPHGEDFEKDLAALKGSFNETPESQPQTEMAKTVPAAPLEVALQGNDDEAMTQVAPTVVAAPKTEAAPVTRPPATMTDLDPFIRNADNAFQTGDENGFGELVRQIDAGAAGNVANLNAEIDRLERLQPGERKADHAARIEQLRFDAQLYEKTAEWRKAQLELMQARRELVETTAEIDKTTREIDARDASPPTMVSPQMESASTVRAPAEIPQVALQRKLEELTAKRDELLKRIPGLEARVNDLAAVLEKLKTLQSRASKEAEGEKKKAKPTEAVPAGSGSAFDESGNPMAPAQRPDKDLFQKKAETGPGMDARVKQGAGYLHDPGQAAVDALDWLDKKLGGKKQNGG